MPPVVPLTPQRVMSSEGSRTDLSRIQQIDLTRTSKVKKQLAPVPNLQAAIRSSTSEVTVKRQPQKQPPASQVLTPNKIQVQIPSIQQSAINNLA